MLIFGNLLPRPLRLIAHRLIWPHRRRDFRLPYVLARLRSEPARPAYDAVFVLDERSRGWILEGICREIAQRFPGKTEFCYSSRRLPAARAYFISHYALLPDALRENPCLHRAAVFVWYTHPRPLSYSERELVYALNHARKVFCPNSWLPEYLAAQGVRRSRLAMVLGGADPARFRVHERGSGGIGFSMAYYERKRPERVIEVAKAFPDKEILLLGRGWTKYPRFAELQALSNFRYVESDYDEYPRHYARMDVFVSPADLEGGPIPLLEAMMSNALPVSSNTGFARDLIRHGQNGYIFDVDASPETVNHLIEEAFANTSDVRRTVKHLTWESFASKICAYMQAGSDRPWLSLPG